MLKLLGKTLRSSTFKLALISIVAFGAIVITLFSYVYLATTSYLRSQSDRNITAEYAILQKVYDSAGRAGLIALIRQRSSDHAVEGGLYLLADASFTPIAGNLKAWPEALWPPKESENFKEAEWKSDEAGRPLLRAAFKTLSDGNHLLVGMAIDDLDEFSERIKVALMLAITLILFLAGTASISITRRTVGRIESITATSRAIMQTGLGKRIPLRGTQDEWDRVAESLNLMLARIETLMADVKQVTDNVAHDLRTPLTRMRGRLEKAYLRPRESNYDQSLISDTIADLDSVLRIFSSLIRISQIEARNQKSQFCPVNLAEMGSQIVELFDPAAEEKHGRLILYGDRCVLVPGNRDLLFEAVANLVDNAIKHGYPHGQVGVEIKNSDGGAVVSVADDGPGIPAGEHQNVFKRFYRLERSRHTSGNGLGLSLVDAVAQLHGARIEMVDNKPGLKVCLLFPNSSVPTLNAAITISH